MRIPLIATLIASALLALNAQAADLLQIYKEALANDAQYASARSALTAGREKVVQGRAALLPAIGFSGSNYRNNSSTSLDGAPNSIDHTFNSSNYTLSLSQPVFRWVNWEQYAQSKLAVAGSEAQFAQSQLDLIIRVAQAYFDVLAAQDTIDTVQAQKTATAEQLASAKRNFEVGTQTITDTHEAQARYDLILSQEFASRADLDNKRSALQSIIGQAPADLAGLRAGVTLSAPEPAFIAPWIESAEKQNYGVVGAQIALESAKREIAKSRAGHYPTLDAVISANRSTTYGSGTNTNSIGVQWNIPLFAGFSVDSHVRESIAMEEKSRNDLETTRRSAAQGARQAYRGVNSGLAQVKALEAAEVSSKSALESNKLGYQVGVRINIDVLNAQQQLYSTQRDLAKARYDTIMNGLRLKSAAGSLKEDDLATVNSLLKQ